MGGDLDIVKYLVSKGANIKSNIDLALTIAARNNKIDMMKYLIKNGANIRSNNDFILLNALIRNYYYSEIKFIFFNMDINSQITNEDILKKFYLQNNKSKILVRDVIFAYACSIDNVKLVKYLINNGVSFDYVSNISHKYICINIKSYLNSIPKSYPINTIINGLFYLTIGVLIIEVIKYLTQ